MIMSMNMNIPMRMSHSLVVQVQYSLLGFFFPSVRQVGKVGIRKASKVPTGSRRRPMYLQHAVAVTVNAVGLFHSLP